ncbi:MAG: Lar family restriction alleviation protein [Terriglobales bacterium]
MTTPELLCCPFCGVAPYFDEVPSQPRFMVECIEGCAHARVSFTERKHAIAAWNTRARDAASYKAGMLRAAEICAQQEGFQSGTEMTIRAEAEKP